MSSRSGDVIIWTSDQMSICQVGVVLDDGQSSQSLYDWTTKSAGANEHARAWVEKTGVRILIWDGSGDPTRL